MALNEAVELAVNSCINEGILADILKKNRAEVCNLILYEYDEQKQLAIAREGAKKAGREEGRAQGIAQGIAQGREAEKVMEDLENGFRNCRNSIEQKQNR